MLKSIYKFISNNDFSINIINNQIDINNFIDIIILESKKIVLQIPLGYLVIIGNDLVIKRLLNKEILINGTIKSLELNSNA